MRRPYLPPGRHGQAKQFHSLAIRAHSTIDPCRLAHLFALFAKTEQAVAGADKYPVTADRRGRVAWGTQIIRRQHLPIATGTQKKRD